MSLSFWSTASDAIQESSHESIPTTTALNLVAALIAAKLRLFTAGELRVRDDTAEIAGSGGFSHIEIGSHPDNRKKLVAVKRSRLFPRSHKQVEGGAFTKHLAQLTLELQILSDSSLTDHPHVLNLVGICSDLTKLVAPFWLVVEFAEHGTLRTCLADVKNGISSRDRFELVAQVSSGLAAVHSLRIAHGDVKTENVLVFNERGNWLAKISDFGQSVVAIESGLHKPAKIIPPAGTPLLNAPEIRNGSCYLVPEFTLENAISTDVFSFGLLVWEVLQKGKTFFDTSWPGYGSESGDLDLMQDYLNNLSENELCRYGQKFLDTVACDFGDLLPSLRTIMDICLQDNPDRRGSMLEVTVVLRRDGVEERGGQMIFHNHLLEDQPGAFTINREDVLSLWTVNHSLGEIRRLGRRENCLIDDMPEVFREMILQDLELLTQSESVPQIARAHAALTISEFHAFRVIPGKTSVKKAVEWLHAASILGNKKALYWYDRVAHATSITLASLVTRQQNIRIPKQTLTMISTDYLAEGVRYFSINLKERASRLLEGNMPSLDTPIGAMFEATLLNAKMVDSLGILHLFALVGENDGIANYHRIPSQGIKSDLGWNAAHYACLGGNISTLNTLINSGISVSERSLHNITPLHLTIFIPVDSLSGAVDLLVGNGASADAISDVVDWDEYDISLSGTPLEWAVLSRNLQLTRLLAPHSSSSIAHCLEIAVSLFFYEIAKELFYWCRKLGQTPWEKEPFERLKIIHRPFAHWIAHGPDRRVAIQNTIRFCIDEKLLRHGCGDGISHIMVCIAHAAFDDDLYIIQALISAYPESHIKSHKTGKDPLHIALSRSGNDRRWTSIIKSLSDFYTLQELQEPILEDKISIFNLAVQVGSTVGVQVLLQRGVDINYAPESNEPPLMYWVHSSKPTKEMLLLLLESGANVQIDAKESGSPSEFDALLTATWNKFGFDIFLENLLHEDNCAKILHRAIRMAIFGALPIPDAVMESNEHGRRSSYGTVPQGKLEAHWVDMFRALLCHSISAGHINDVDDNGMTLLQKATFWLHIDVVRLLLEAGADPCVPLVQKNGEKLVSFYPIQLCCGRGLDTVTKWLDLNHANEFHNDATSLPPWKKLEKNMTVAMELLQSHLSRGDDISQGATRLSLAWNMLYAPEIERLTAIIPAEAGQPGERHTDVQGFAHDTEDLVLAARDLGPRKLVIWAVKKNFIPRQLVTFDYRSEHGPPATIEPHNWDVL